MHQSTEIFPPIVKYLHFFFLLGKAEVVVWPCGQPHHPACAGLKLCNGSRKIVVRGENKSDFWSCSALATNQANIVISCDNNVVHNGKWKFVVLKLEIVTLYQLESVSKAHNSQLLYAFLDGCLWCGLLWPSKTVDTYIYLV